MPVVKRILVPLVIVWGLTQVAVIFWLLKRDASAEPTVYIHATPAPSNSTIEWGKSSWDPEMLIITASGDLPGGARNDYRYYAINLRGKDTGSVRVDRVTGEVERCARHFGFEDITSKDWCPKEAR